MYFDNVGGPITDAVLPLINTGARIAICGQISQYNNTKPQLGPRLLHHLIIGRVRNWRAGTGPAGSRAAKTSSKDSRTSPGPSSVCSKVRIPASGW